ncbi:polyphosphoinositide phosphatase-like [Plakobranchus ocellatus]|uniref:Polyphosphoinositide phosphatase-like n=1 Tax=Plakobranchus ocellatus TaxID=259542 RepID=A0AAV3YE53_9GAST|nr:polyphosphoinositide phosphatase-like [Plakobranchus ocellatus]
MEEVPLITWTQKLVLYETKARYYVVGSNKAETRFRVLKIDRTEPRELSIHDDKVEYNRTEIRSVLSMIDGGNKPKKGNIYAGLSKNISAFGIAGFVRFMEGYYMILITKRKKAAVIGPHTLYKIEDTSMIYIPNDTVRVIHQDESRYLKMFQNVDLSSNFYFSYSYDLTHTLQYNMAPSCSPSAKSSSGQAESYTYQPTPGGQNKNAVHPLSDPEPGIKPNPVLTPSAFAKGDADTDGVGDRAEAKDSTQQQPVPMSELTDKGFGIEDLASVHNIPTNSPLDILTQGDREIKKVPTVYGVKSAPNRKFVWNNHLLDPFENKVHSDWILYIIHGFIGQSNVCVYGKSVYLTVLGRRSNQFAGTRFLKRGTNLEGYVANEVETEQIVQDTAVTFLSHGKVSSFVQHRGSVPLFWSQDIAKMVPKPPISLDQRDPYSSAAGMHFNQLLCRYGAPLIVLNLVKTKENKRHESILSEGFYQTVEYLNQFLPVQHAIQYIRFDMARVNKRKDADVMLRLNRIARYCMKKTGLFLNVQPSQASYLLKDPEMKTLLGQWGPTGCKQTGVVRTNCVDCLDRTNTAQFALGRSALAYQLYAMGVLQSTHLDFDTDCVKMLEELYEDHGDTLALQYGGSQLVHRIKGYRKIAPWTSHSRDIMQTLSRYYSNAFSDVEKQQAFNLFLGVFVPKEGEPNLWDLPTDYYLHNKPAMGKHIDRHNYCQWWKSDVWDCLPMPQDEVSKTKPNSVDVQTLPQTDEHVNSFYEYYRPAELTSFDEMYQLYLSQVSWKHIPKNATDFSPFCVRHSAEQGSDRLNPGFMLMSQFLPGASRAESNPNVSGKDSTSSVASFGSEGSSESSDDSDGEGGAHLSDGSSDSESADDDANYVSFKDLLPSMKEVYNTEIVNPGSRDRNIYQRYVDIGRGHISRPELSFDGAETQKRDPSPSASTESGKASTQWHVPAPKPPGESSPPGESPKRLPPGIDIFPISAFKLDSSFFVEPPPVSRQARDLYTAYVQRGKYGAGPPLEIDRLSYIKYVSKKYL